MEDILRLSLCHTWLYLTWPSLRICDMLLLGILPVHVVDSLLLLLQIIVAPLLCDVLYWRLRLQCFLRWTPTLTFASRTSESHQGFSAILAGTPFLLSIVAYTPSRNHSSPPAITNPDSIVVSMNILRLSSTGLFLYHVSEFFSLIAWITTIFGNIMWVTVPMYRRDENIIIALRLALSISIL